MSANLNLGGTPPRNTLVESVILLLLVIPIYGCFWPPDSYVSIGSATADSVYVEKTTSLPITNVLLVAISLAAGWLLYLIQRWYGKIQHLYLGYALVLLAFLSSGWSAMPTGTFLRALRLLPPIAMAVALAQILPIPRVLRIMTIGLLISALISIVLVVALPKYGLTYASGHIDVAWRGAMVQKNFTGFTFGIGLVIIFGAWQMRSISWPIALFTAALSVIILIKSDSITALISALAGLIVMCVATFMQRAPSSIRPLILFIVFIFLTLFFIVFTMEPDLLFGAIGRNSTLTGRTQIWAAVWQRILAHPIRGYGWAFWVMSDNPVKLEIWREVGDTVAHSHNTWLDIWLQLGLAGLVIAIVTLVLLMGRSIFLVLTSQRVGAGLYLGIAVFLITRSFAEVEFTDPAFGGLFYVWWAALVAVRETRRGRQQVAVSIPSRPVVQPAG